MIGRRPVLCAAGAALVSASARAGCLEPSLALGRGFHLGEVLRRPRRDFDDMAAAGAQLLRFGIPLRASADGASYQWPSAALDELEATLQQARRLGLRVVPVLRPPPEPPSRLWRDKSLQDSLNEVWKSLARSLQGRPEVAAFDLVNEPHPDGPNFEAKERVWADLASRLIQTIRAEDRERMIVYEPSPGARPMAFRYVQALPFDNLVYSVHFYEPFEFTHQRIGDPRFPDVVGFPFTSLAMGRWDADRLRSELEPVRAFEARSARPIYVGEFGAVRWAPDGSSLKYLSTLTAMFKQYRWSWTYHAFREWHGWDAEMNNAEASRVRTTDEPAFQVLREALRTC